LAAYLAEALGLARDAVELIRVAAPLHDVGKIGIPDSILLKPGKLEREEFEIMKTHTTIGAGILSGSRSRLLQLSEEIALYHHERWDGNGYAGLAGHDIPIAARVVAVADVFDALSHARPYRPAWPIEKAIGEIRAEGGQHFDPDVVGAFMDLHGELIESGPDVTRRPVHAAGSEAPAAGDGVAAGDEGAAGREDADGVAPDPATRDAAAGTAVPRTRS
ncbi:MAG: HD-GYP domain-containing protein, partial [Longimicrobiales bacterium]